MHIIGLGTAPGECNVVEWLEISGRARSWCGNDLQLNHTETYFLTVTAINGAMVPLNVSVSSDGGCYIGLRETVIPSS